VVAEGFDTARTPSRWAHRQGGGLGGGSGVRITRAINRFEADYVLRTGRHTVRPRAGGAPMSAHAGSLSYNIEDRSITSA
jgi:hypothetical protein